MDLQTKFKILSLNLLFSLKIIEREYKKDNFCSIFYKLLPWRLYFTILFAKLEFCWCILRFMYY